MPNYQVSQRQNIGQWWTSRADDTEQASLLRSGTLILPPHEGWDLPAAIDWNADPFNQKNWRFQFHCLKWLEPLRRVALGRGADAEPSKTLWNEIVASWITDNLMGDDKFAWMDMADGVRAIELVLGAPIASTELTPKLLEALEIHVERLRDPNRRAIGNHAMHQLSGLFVAASFLGLVEAQDFAVTELETLFHGEYDGQGTNAEGAVSYHDLNFHWWNDVITRLETEEIPAGHLRTVLERSRSSIVHFVRPDGFLEMIGDTAEAKLLSADNTAENLFVRTKGDEGTAPERTQLTLDAGYALGRSGWGTLNRRFEDETFYSLRFGRNDAVHGHDDQGSFTVFSNSVPWIVDPGMYAYQSHPFRRFFLSREAHNVVVAPGEFTQPGEAELVWYYTSTTADVYHVRATPYEGFTIERTFIYVKPLECFLVFDSVTKTEPNKNDLVFVQRWNFHPSVKVAKGMRSAILERGRQKATMRWLKRPLLHLADGSENPLAGWFSPSYSVATPTNYLDAKTSVPGDFSWCTVISVGPKDIIPLSQSTVNNQMTIRLDSGGDELLLTVDPEETILWEKSTNFFNG